jgi:hypothetical protein
MRRLVLPEPIQAAEHSILSGPHPIASMVRRVNPVDEPSWDVTVAAMPGASFYHGSAWARVLQHAYGFHPCYFTCDATASLFPMVEVDSWLTGRRGISLPFADECAPLCADARSWDRLWQAALGFARERGWRYLECRGGRSWFRGAPSSTSYYGHRLALGEDRPALSSRVEGSVRRAVRKAQQSGLRVEFSRSEDALRVFYGLLCRTRKRLGVPPQPFAFFQQIERQILAREQGWVVLAWHGRIPVAGAVFFCSGKTAYYRFAASNAAWQHLRPSNLVLWEAIEWFEKQGFAGLDFGRTSLDNEGLRRFKCSWGAEERRIEYVRFDLRSRSFVAARDRASGWHNRVFRLLPLALSRLAGTVLYRHVA